MKHDFLKTLFQMEKTHLQYSTIYMYIAIRFTGKVGQNWAIIPTDKLMKDLIISLDMICKVWK